MQWFLSCQSHTTIRVNSSVVSVFHRDLLFLIFFFALSLQLFGRAQRQGILVVLLFLRNAIGLQLSSLVLLVQWWPSVPFCHCKNPRSFMNWWELKKWPDSSVYQRISRGRSLTLLEWSSFKASIYLEWYSSTSSSAGRCPGTLGLGVWIGFPISTCIGFLYGRGVPNRPTKMGRAIPKFFCNPSRNPAKNVYV